MLPSVSAEPACGDPLRAGHLWIRVKLGMSDNEPCGRRIRYIPGHLASGTMRGSREPVFGRPSTVFFVIISLDDSMRCNGVVTADKGTEPFCVFLQFLSRLIRSRLAALRHRSPQYLAGKREAKLSNVQANQNLLAAPEGAPLGCKPLHGPAQG